MANTTIALKKSATSSAKPSTLANGEIAINYADGIIYYRHANGVIASISAATFNYFGTVDANGTLLVSDTQGDVVSIYPGDGVTIVGDAVNDRMYVNATPIGASANGWANTKLSNSTVTLAGALTTTGSVTSNGYVYITPTGGEEGGEIQLQATGVNTAWSIDSYQNNFRVFARSGTTVSNLNFFHATGGSLRLGVNKTDPAYAIDVTGDVNISGTYRVNGTPISSGGSMDYAYANQIGAASNTWANTVGTAGNNYMISIATGINSNAVNNAVGANGWANTLSTSDRAIANAASNSANAYTVTVGAAANTWANTKLANTSGVSFAGDLFFPTGNVAIGSGSSTFNSIGYRLYVNGSFAANTKSFVIDHPTKPGMKLRYGSLEGPENGVYVRGKLDGIKVIELPDYWEGLVDLNTITVQLTAIGHAQNLYVAAIDGLKIHIDTENHTQPYCYYTVFAERKDVEKLVVEY